MRALLTTVLLMSLGACSLPEQSRSRQFAPYAPLQARITSLTANGPLFHVNRPAYVAMFYISPGAGVSMLYPGFGSGSLDGRVFAGSHFANPRINNQSQYLFTAGSTLSPRFLFLIASDRPLNVRQFGTFGSNLQARMGTSFSSMSAYDAMEDLAQLALPSLADDGSWTTDMYVEWPNVISREPAARRVLMSCNGYQVYVPIEYLMEAQARLCPSTSDRETTRAESEEVAKPGARTPIPAEGTGEAEAIRAPEPRDRKAVMERISSSSQLGRPISREVGGVQRGELGRTGSRARPEPGVGSRPSPGSTSVGSGGASRSPGATSAGSRPASPGAGPSSGGASAPSASPSSGSGGGGGTPVSAPTSRDSGGGG